MDQFCLSGRKEKQRWPFLEQAKRIPNGFCVGEKCWLKNKITNEITMTQIARDGDKRFIRADLKSSLKSPTWLLFGCRGPWGPVSCCSNHCPAILCFSLTCNAVMYPHHFKKISTQPSRVSFWFPELFPHSWPSSSLWLVHSTGFKTNGFFLQVDQL